MNLHAPMRTNNQILLLAYLFLLVSIATVAAIGITFSGSQNEMDTLVEGQNKVFVTAGAGKKAKVTWR